MMAIRSALGALLLSTLGCAFAGPPPPAPPAPLSARAPEEASLRVLLEALREGILTRKEAALQLLVDAGPPAAPVLRSMLTRRDLPADPIVADLIRSLQIEEGALRRVAIDQLFLRGKAVEPDLWDAIFTTESREVVLLCVEILTLMEGDHPPVALVVDVLWNWSVLPSSSATREGAAARIVPVREADRGNRFPRLKDDYSPSQVDPEPSLIYFPVSAEEVHQGPADGKNR